MWQIRIPQTLLLLSRFFVLNSVSLIAARDRPFKFRFNGNCSSSRPLCQAHLLVQLRNYRKETSIKFHFKRHRLRSKKKGGVSNQSSDQRHSFVGIIYFSSKHTATTSCKENSMSNRFGMKIPVINTRVFLKNLTAASLAKQLMLIKLFTLETNKTTSDWCLVIRQLVSQFDCSTNLPLNYNLKHRLLKILLWRRCFWSSLHNLVTLGTRDNKYDSCPLFTNTPSFDFLLLSACSVFFEDWFIVFE